MQKKSIKLDVDGLILINKPYGLSSNHALTRIKKKFHPKKAGHTGTLDPLACGLLPICLGQATKFSSYLLDEDKTYQAGDLQSKHREARPQSGYRHRPSDCSRPRSRFLERFHQPRSRGSLRYCLRTD